MPHRKTINPKEQFSKWLAKYGAIVWGIYAFAILALVAYRPEAAMSCVWLTLIMTCNKALDTVAYTRNSTIEKILLSAIDKTRIEVGLKPGIDSSVQAEETCEEESNG